MRQNVKTMTEYLASSKRQTTKNKNEKQKLAVKDCFFCFIYFNLNYNKLQNLY